MRINICDFFCILCQSQLSSAIYFLSSSSSLSAFQRDEAVCNSRDHQGITAPPMSISQYLHLQFDKLIEEILSPRVLAYLSGQGFTKLTLQTGATALDTADLSGAGGDLTVETFQYKPSLAEVRLGGEV